MFLGNKPDFAWIPVEKVRYGSRRPHMRKHSLCRCGTIIGGDNARF